LFLELGGALESTAAQTTKSNNLGKVLASDFALQTTGEKKQNEPRPTRHLADTSTFSQRPNIHDVAVVVDIKNGPRHDGCSFDSTPVPVSMRAPL